MRYTRETVPFGQAGTEIGISSVKSLIREGAGHPSIHDIAADVIHKIPPEDNRARLNALFRFAQSKFHYVKDPWHIEYVKSPEAVAQELAQKGRVTGDCDDAVVFLGSLIETAGYPTRVSMIKADPQRDDYSHIYLEAYDGKKWIPMDIINKMNVMGWEYKKHNGKRSDNVFHGYRGSVDLSKFIPMSIPGSTGTGMAKQGRSPWSLEAWALSGTMGEEKEEGVGDITLLLISLALGIYFGA